VVPPRRDIRWDKNSDEHSHPTQASFRVSKPGSYEPYMFISAGNICKGSELCHTRTFTKQLWRHWIRLDRSCRGCEVWETIVRLDELGQRKMVRLIIRLWVNAGKQTDHLMKYPDSLSYGWFVSLSAFTNRLIIFSLPKFVQTDPILCLYYRRWMMHLDGWSVPYPCMPHERGTISILCYYFMLFL
jgi:hypothetical protein